MEISLTSETDIKVVLLENIGDERSRKVILEYDSMHHVLNYSWKLEYMNEIFAN